MLDTVEKRLKVLDNVKRQATTKQGINIGVHALPSSQPPQADKSGFMDMAVKGVQKLKNTFRGSANSNSIIPIQEVNEAVRDSLNKSFVNNELDKSAPLPDQVKTRRKSVSVEGVTDSSKGGGNTVVRRGSVDNSDGKSSSGKNVKLRNSLASIPDEDYEEDEEDNNGGDEKQDKDVPYYETV